jgi:hypothetical protein
LQIQWHSEPHNWIYRHYHAALKAFDAFIATFPWGIREQCEGRLGRQQAGTAFLQHCMLNIDTTMFQQLLAKSQWNQSLSSRDQAALPPLI